jgi:hypothetical protein
MTATKTLVKRSYKKTVNLKANITAVLKLTNDAVLNHNHVITIESFAITPFKGSTKKLTAVERGCLRAIYYLFSTNTKKIRPVPTEVITLPEFITLESLQAL